MSITNGDIALACMRVFVDQLVAGGLGAVCISPGSRSTPLALAFARDGRIPVSVHVDERSAAFFALGVAKATGHPAACVCTSGTATANYFPAVVEAERSRIPLLLLTADRPGELHDTGANQTIDQIELYGRYAHFIAADLPRASDGAAASWRALAARALHATATPPTKPVHVNIPFAEPLVPTGATVDLGIDELLAGITQERADPAGDVEGVARTLVDVRDGLVLAGTLRRPNAAAAELADRLGWPLLAEPTSGMRRGGALRAGQLLLLGDAMPAPQIVAQFGAAPTSRAALALTATVPTLVVFEDGAPADPNRRARHTVRGDADVLSHIAGTVPTEWAKRWEAADHAARAAVDALLDGWDKPFEGRIARDVYATVPDGSTLVAGSSMPIRDLDTYARPRNGVRVLANRGASGIDGLISTVLGVASAGAPTYAIAGDLSMLHDASTLLWNGARGLNAVFVVVNNGGGGIFDLLAQSDLPERDALFVTPHDVDLRSLAAAARAGYERVERSPDVAPAIAAAAERGGVQIVDVIVDRSRAKSLRALVRDRVIEVSRDYA